MQEKIRVGVSSCLLGNPVRYDGGHKHDRYITDTLGKYFDFVPVCPEVECGLPIPREAMRLLGDPEAPRLVTSRSEIDLTDQMLSYCHTRVRELKKNDLCAFIFKKDSPSSGLHKVKVYNKSGHSQKNGRGFFAAAFTSHFPLLPVEEEGRLNDAGLRESFIEKVFCYYRWKTFLQQKPDYKSLIDFHSNHKLQLMSHSPKHLSKMGKMVAAGKNIPEETLLTGYQSDLMEAMSLKATVKKNVNVLYHIAGYFKKLINSDEKNELISLIESYANHTAPLIIPLTLANHFIRKYNISYLQNQTYLEPHPSELMLRNQV